MAKKLDDVLDGFRARAAVDGPEMVEFFDAVDQHFRNLAGQLEKARKQLGVSQRELSQRSGMAQSEISRILSGRTPNPGISTYERLADAIGCTIALVPKAALQAVIQKYGVLSLKNSGARSKRARRRTSSSGSAATRLRRVPAEAE